MLVIDGIHAGYGSAQVLHDVSLTVDDGEIVTVIGSNGAGKTTLMWVISGLLAPSGGSVTFHDRDITGARPSEIARAGISLVPQDRDLFVAMSVHENLLVATTLLPRRKRRARVDELYDLFPTLTEWRKRAVGSLSGGQRAMVNLAVGVAADPSMLLVDEPSSGLSPQAAEAMFDRVAELGNAGTSVLLVEQDAYAALQIAKRGYIIEQGRVVGEGASQELMGQESIRKAYLGI
jgi:branched-chain amino acid transport system ATP-binding protein